MKMRIALLSGLLTLVAGAALAIPTSPIPTDQDDSLLTDLLATDLDQAPALFELGFAETDSQVQLQLSQQVPFPCPRGPFGPIFIIYRPGPSTGPYDPTSCFPFPWPF